MLVAVSKMAVKLTGNQPCIASMGYTHAGALMSEQDRPIVENMERIDRFLVRVFHMIDKWGTASVPRYLQTNIQSTDNSM